MKHLLNFFHELEQLKRIRNEGLRLAGVNDPGSIAGHSLRAAQIGYVLAILEKYESPEQVASMLVFHDMGECRVGDVHKVANRYVTADEKRAVEDQLKNLPDEVSEAIFAIWDQVETKSTVAGIIAKDADYLELAFTAKAYKELGYQSVQNWIDNITQAVQTKTAKEIMKHIDSVNSTDWWIGLKKLDLDSG
jgi:putative hydrolases of HD superfamily